VKDKAALHRVLQRAASDPAASTLRGKLYERCIAVPRFAHGTVKGNDGDLQLVRLTAPKFSFKRSLQLVHFHKLADLASK